MKNYKYTCLLLLIGVATNKGYAQEVINTAEIKFGREVKIFSDKVKLYYIKNHQPMLLENGSYLIENNTQKAKITIVNQLLSGSVTVNEKENRRADYTILNSLVATYKLFTDGNLVMDAYQKNKVAYFKEYGDDKVLNNEGWVSLDVKKHFGIGISKRYYKEGKLAKISNQVTATYTEFYPNGNKKLISGPNIHEEYKENGNLYNKQYTKDKVRYNDYYENGKLNTRWHINNQKNEETDYYKDGVLQKKEIIKVINGEKRLFIYEGKLTSNEPHATSGVKAVN
ncbi:hypothetical protein EZ449_09150 [Pedobacter frigidisoli]|uniref:Antitoxin component YwqK of the YwqJK toxin-antitoxin module n=1 Tax=Pedobacter frigidisoli TaxID=2530455 RepID=A0A4R0P592_9SPHI|nr:hypothetical protein EZ449_09150 [Pedobacter frigidisoli]